MLKFMVVLYRRPDLSPTQFRHHLETIHASLAKALPGLKEYTQNHAIPDSKRDHPGWDAVIELYFDNREIMEAAWASPQGAASDADLSLFADLTRTTWSIVEELNLLP
ncbi:MAG TPA: EthD family reductase [Candidatus Sulfotelmatobacter sp.]|nr:EthD family reductase [Candidatus Sulfotelmatobacter sp.]